MTSLGAINQLVAAITLSPSLITLTQALHPPCSLLRPCPLPEQITSPFVPAPYWILSQHLLLFIETNASVNLSAPPLGCVPFRAGSNVHSPLRLQHLKC